MQEVQTSDVATRMAPGPRAWPLLGNLGLFRGLLPFIEEQRALHGDVFRMTTPSMRALVVSNPDHIQHVLLNHRHNYVKGTAYEHARGILGQGLVTLEGEAWRERRTLAQPAFHRKSLEGLAQIMVESGARHFDDLTAGLQGGAREVDMHQEMTRVTMDVVVNALFGPDLLARGAVSYETMNELLEIISAGLSGVPLPSWLPTPHNIKFRRTLRELNVTIFEIIRAARERRADVDGTLLAMLLDARDGEGHPLSDQAIRDEVITLFVAGHETTALTLTWMFVFLADHPEVLQRMIAEVDHVLAGRDPGFADVPQLRYLRQVTDETLRLRSPAAMVGRNAVAADELGGYRVEPGDVVLPYIWGAHRHAAHWSEPERFDPERFLPEQNKRRHPGSYLPFIIGPRICIGNTFALVETAILMAQMLVRYEFKLLPGQNVAPVAIATVRPSKAVLVELRSRRRVA